MQGQAPVPDLAASPTLAAARSRLAASTEQTLAFIRSLDDAALTREVIVFGGTRMTSSEVLDIALGHEAHHKGQVWLMARLIGLQPPRYIQLSQGPDAVSGDGQDHAALPNPSGER